MDCLKSCCINSIKCCTDKLLQVANCVIGIPSIGAIVAKSYKISGLREVSWAMLIAPLSTLVLLNMMLLFHQESK